MKEWWSHGKPPQALRWRKGIQGHWAGVNPHSPRPSHSRDGYNKPCLLPPCLPTVTSAPHVYGCCLNPFIPPSSYYLQYLLLLIPLLVNAHAALMLDYKTQVPLSLFKRRPKTLKPKANIKSKGNACSYSNREEQHPCLRDVLDEKENWTFILLKIIFST